MTPDQIKYLLTSTATLLPAADKVGQGHGLVQWGKAMLGKTPSLATAQQSFPVSTGTGSLDASRGSSRLVLSGVTLKGEVDLHGQPFNAAAMAAAEAAGTAWSGGAWNGSTWAGEGWSADGTSWASGVWTSRTWAGDDWSSRTWATGTWTGTSWADGSWNSRTWAGSDWDSRTWASRTWADGYWG
jgi:serine protease AprX